MFDERPDHPGHDTVARFGSRESQPGAPTPPRSRRLRRDEPRDPTPGTVRRARRSGELMRLAAAKVSSPDIARHFGYATPAAVRSRVAADRDRLPPNEPIPEAPHEYHLVSQLSGVLFDQLWRRDPERIEVFQDSVALVTELLEWEPIVWVPPQLPEGCDPGAFGATRGEWTRGLELRSSGHSFHDIADACGVAEPFDAVVMVIHDLDAYRRESVTRLRTRQVKQIDAELERQWPQLAHPGRVRVEVAHAVLTLLEHRTRIRGLRYRHDPGRALVEIRPINHLTEEGSSP